MSAHAAMDTDSADRGKTKSEKLLKKLTSQSCIKKGNENCSTPHEQRSRGGSNDTPESFTSEFKLKTPSISSSTEILQNVRRDSGDGDESRTSKIKYSKGESIDLAAAAKNAGSQLKIRPELSQKFRPGVVNQIIETVVKEHLVGKEYSADEAQAWTKTITDTIKLKTKEQNFARYKLVVFVVLGERRSQGISSAYRCLWDAEADCAATYTFTNDSIYCVGMVFGVYYY